MTAGTVPLLVRPWKVPLKDATADTHSGRGNLHRACDRTASCPATDKSSPGDLPGPSAQNPAKSGRSHCPDDAAAWRRGNPAVTRIAFAKQQPPEWPRAMGPKGREKARFTYFGKPRWVRAKGGAAQPGHQTGRTFEWPRRAFQISRPDSGTNRRARPPTRKPNRRAPGPPRARKLCPGRPPSLRCVGRECGVVGGR